MVALDRNTIVGIDFLVVGFVLTGLGYIVAQSVPIAAIGVDIAIIGALVLLVVPEPIPQDAYRALLDDSISNVEMILEESNLEERAYFIPTRGEGGRNQGIRAFLPASARQMTVNNNSLTTNLELLQSVSRSPGRFVHSYGGAVGLVLIPPGNEIVKLAKVQEGDDLEDSLRSVLVSYSDLASSVMSIDEREGGKDLVKINISNPKLTPKYHFFERCLGSPVSCIACCVVAVAKGSIVRFVDEKKQGAQIRLTLEFVPTNGAS